MDLSSENFLDLRPNFCNSCGKSLKEISELAEFPMFFPLMKNYLVYHLLTCSNPKCYPKCSQCLQECQNDKVYLNLPPLVFCQNH